MTIRDELLALKDRTGVILPLKVVEWAKAHPESALHNSLEWNDKEAGHQWRIQQVRQLVAIHVVNGDGQRQFVSLSIDRQTRGGYRDIDDIMPVPDLRDILLADALKELERVEARYNALAELTEVWKAARRVRSKRGTAGVGVAQRPAA